MRLRFRALVGLAALAGTFLLPPPAASGTTLPATAAAMYRGEGDDVVRIPVTSAPTIVKSTHQGESNFIVWTLTTGGKKADLIANGIGEHKDTAVFNASRSHRIRSLSVTADGSWTIQVLPITKARYWAINAKGTGSDVLRLTAPSKGLRRLTIRHSGESNFIIWALDNRGRYQDLLINKIGSYKGRVVLPPGTRYAAITADGAWTISRR